MSKKRDKLRMMTFATKFFTILTFVSNWYMAASEDEVIQADELIELGAGICGILGMKTKIESPSTESY